MRQLAALQGIGWALLALGEQLADVADATTDCATQLAGIADAVDALRTGPPACAACEPHSGVPCRNQPAEGNR